MQQATQTLSTSPREASAEELTRFSSNVAADIAALIDTVEKGDNQAKVLAERFHVESVRNAARIDALQRQVETLSKLAASRTELEELATIVSAASLPQDRGFSVIYPAGMSVEALGLDGCTIENGGIALPLTSRRSLLFGNDPLTGDVVMPSDLVAIFTPTSEGSGATFETTLPSLALSDDVMMPFARTVRYGSGATRQRIGGTLEVLIPPSLRGSLRVNLLELVPYPLNTTIVEAVRFYSPVGAALGSITLGQSGALTLPISVGSVGRIQIDITGTSPSYIGGACVFRYGLSKVGLYDARYGDTGEFRAVTSAPGVKTLQGLAFNTTLGSSSSLIRAGQLRLVVQVGDSVDAATWRTVYDTDIYRSYYTGAAENSYFPSGGVFCVGNALRVLGTLRGDGYPVLRDILLTHTS